MTDAELPERRRLACRRETGIVLSSSFSLRREGNLKVELKTGALRGVAGEPPALRLTDEM